MLNIMELFAQKIAKSSIVYVGIDNGLNGAVVAIDQDASFIEYWDTPTLEIKQEKRKGKFTIHREFVTSEMNKIVKHIVGAGRSFTVFKFFLEKAQAMPEQGLSSTFKTGYGAGLWEGIVSALGVSYDIVPATTWTKHVLKDMPVGETKKRSLLKCQRVFPLLKLTGERGAKLTKDGRSDAALIAYYGWLISRGMQDPKELKRRPVRKK